MHDHDALFLFLKQSSLPSCQDYYLTPSHPLQGGYGNVQLTLDLHNSFLSLDVFLPITSTEGGKI